MSKTFCAYPWKHLFVQPSGHQKICCLSNENITKDDDYRQFNLARDPLFASWNSNYMKNIRKKMLNGEQSTTCQRCYQQEQNGLMSMRDTKNEEYYRNNTSADGSVTGQPGHVELHFGNVCNLTCKMCSQMFSTSIGKELIKMGEQDPDFLRWVKKQGGVVNNWTAELDVTYDWFKNNKIKKEVFESVSKNVSGLSIVGGEPTAVKEFYELLEYCDTKGTLSGKSVTLITNLTNTNKNLTKWLEHTRQFVVYCSIDGLLERNEYIRYPTDWSKVLRSLDFYKDIIQKHPDAGMHFGPAIQLLNIDQLADMVMFFEKFKADHRLNSHVHWTGLVSAPVICDYRNAPKRYKEQVVEILKSKLTHINEGKNTDAIQGHINNLESSLDTEVDQYVIDAFVRYNDFQDKFRNCTSWRTLLPDLERSIVDAAGVKAVL